MAYNNAPQGRMSAVQYTQRPSPMTRRSAILLLTIILIGVGASIGGYYIYQYFSVPADDGGDGGGNGVSAPRAPYLSVPTQITDTPPYQVLIGYSRVAGASVYSIYRSTSVFSATSGAQNVKTTSSLSYVDTVTGTGTYYYGVTAFVDGVETALSSRIAVTIETAQNAAPTSPTMSTPAAMTYSAPYKVHVTYTSSAGATSYTIYRKTSSFTYEDKDTATQITRSTFGLYEDTLASPGTYYYGVTARNNFGESPLSAVLPIILKSTVPILSTPVQTSTSPYRVTMQYTEVFAATGYNIYRSMADFTAKTSATKLTATPTTLLAYTDDVPTTGKYYYAVTSIVESSESSLSPRVSIDVVPAAPSVSPPVLVSVTKSSAVSPYNVVVQHNGVSGASSYNIYRATGAFTLKNSATLLQATTSLTYTDPITTTGTFWYGVTAVVGGVESAVSNVKDITIEAAPQQPLPSAVTLSNPQTSSVIAPFSVVLTYTSQADTTYEIYRKSSSFTDADKNTAIFSGTSVFPTFTESVSTPGTWYYGVVAVNSAGKSPLSNIVSITLTPLAALAAPIMVLASSTRGTTWAGSPSTMAGTMVFSITRVEYATSYVIYKSSSSTMSGATVVATIQQPPASSGSSFSWTHTYTIYKPSCPGVWSTVPVYFQVYAVTTLTGVANTGSVVVQSGYMYMTDKCAFT